MYHSVYQRKVDQLCLLNDTISKLEVILFLWTSITRTNQALRIYAVQSYQELVLVLLLKETEGKACW